jgi:GNAT superfamily N-acetyltransferase
MYWRIGPAYRSRPRPDNKSDLERLAGSGPPPGLLAFDGETAVGWCSLAPRADFGWLTRARYLRPPDDLPVWSAPCFYVRRTHRGRGVMDALIPAAVEAAALAGAPALEAYPVDTTVPGHTGNLFPGVAAAFARHGFEVVARHKPDRPVMRKPLKSVLTAPGGERAVQGVGDGAEAVLSAMLAPSPLPVTWCGWHHRALLPRIRPAFGHVTGQLLAGFTGEEIIQLAGMLERMLGNLRDAFPGPA